MDSIKNKICHIVSVFVILIHTATLTNIDCNGKPFHCVNSTHFKICVDLGAGVSTTFDDFVIQCPKTTVCLESNKFECEYQFPIGDETTDSKTNPHATTIVRNKFTNPIPSSDETRVNGLFNEYLSTIDVTTQAHHIEAMQTERQQVDYPVTGISTDSEYSTSISENKLKQFVSTTDVTTDTTITNLESRSDSVGLLELLFKDRRVLKYELPGTTQLEEIISYNHDFPVTKSSDDVLVYDDTKITNNELSDLNDPHENSPLNYTNNTTVLTDLAENIKKIESNEINTLTTQTDVSGHFKSETPVLHNFTTMRTLLSKILSPSLLPLSNYSESTYEANFINATSTSRSGTYNELPINSNTILSGATSDMTSSDETTLKDQEIIYLNNFSINTSSIPDSNEFTSVTTMSLQSENDTKETQTETAYSSEKLILQSVTTPQNIFSEGWLLATNYSELLPEANTTNNASINKNLAESFGFNFSLSKDTFIKNSEDTLLNDITTKAESDDLFALSAIDSVNTNTLKYITPMILPVNSNTTILSDTTTDPISSDASTLNEQDTIYSNNFNITNPSILASTHLIASVTTVASLNIDTIHTKTDTTFISDKRKFQKKTTPISTLSVGWLPPTNFSERLPEVNTTNDVSSNRHLSGGLGFNVSSLNKDTIIKNSADSLLDDITTKAESDDLSALNAIDNVYYTFKYATPMTLPVNSKTTILSDTTIDPISSDGSTLNEHDTIYSNNFDIKTESIPASTHLIASGTTVASLNEFDTIDMKTDTTFSSENPKFQRKTTPLSTLSEGWLPATNFSERLPEANATNDVSSNINLSGSLGFNASSLNKGTIIKNSADSLLDDVTTKAESDDLSASGTIDSVYSNTLKYRTPMILSVNSNTTILSDTTTDPISGDASTLNEQDTIYSNNFNITTPSIPASTHLIASVTTVASLNIDTIDMKTDTTFSSEKPILQSIKTPQSSLLQVWLPASNYSESLLEANTTNDVTSIINWSAKNASSLSEDTYLVNSQDILLDDLTTNTLDSIFSNTFDHTTPTIASSTKKILNVIQKTSLNDINTFTEANSEDSLIEMNKKDFDASSMQQKYTTKETYSFTHNPLQILWNELPLTTNLEEDRTTNNVLLDTNTNVTSKVESAGKQAQDIKIVNPLKQSLLTETALSGHNPPELFPILPIGQELTKKFHTTTQPIYSVGLDNATTTSNINKVTTEKEAITEFTIYNDTLLGNPADTISLFISPQATTLSNHDIITTPLTGLVTNISNKDYLDEDSHNQEIISKAIKKKNWESVLNLNDLLKENLSDSVSQTEIPRFDDVPVNKNVFVDKIILSSQYRRTTENTPNLAAATTINEITVNTTVVPYVGTVDMLQNVNISTGIKLPVGFNVSKTEKLSNFSSDKVYSSPGMTITTVKNKMKPGISQQLLKDIDESKADLIRNDKNISLIDGREYETNHDNHVLMSSTIFRLSRKNNESTTLKSERSTLVTTISSSDIKIYVDGTKAPVDDTYTSDKISLFEDYQAKTTRRDFNSIVTKSDPTKITTVVHEIASDAISRKDVTNTFLFSNPEQSNNLEMIKENKFEKNTEHDKLITKEMYDHKITTESIRDGIGTLYDDKHFSMPNVTPFLKDNKSNKSLKFELRKIGQNFTSPEQITTKIITNKDLLVNDIKKISTQDNITTISHSTKRKINITNLKFLPKYSERVNFQSKSTEPNIEHYVTSVNMEKSIDLPTHNPLFYDLPFEHTMKAEDIISSKIKNLTSDQTDIFVSIDVVKNNTESSTILEKNAELGRSDHITILPSETSTTAQVHVITRDMLPYKLNASNTTSIYVDTKNNSSSGHSREVNIRKDNYNNGTLATNTRIKESNFVINTETENKLLTTSYIESHSGPNSDISLNEYKHKLKLSQPQTSTVLFEDQRTNKSALDLTVSEKTPKSKGTPEATLVKINLSNSMSETSTVSDLIAFYNIANNSQNISIISDTVFNSTGKEVPYKIYKTVMAVNKQLTNQMLNTETAHIATASIQDEITLIIKREEKNVTELPVIKTDAISEIERLKNVKLINNPNEKSEQPDDEVSFKQYTNSGILKTSSTYLGESVTKDPLYHRPSTSQNFKHTPFTTKLRNTSDTIPKSRSVIVDRGNVEELVIRKRPNITSPSNRRWFRNQTINNKTNQFGHGLRNPIIINKTKNHENSAKDVLRLFTCKNRSRGKYADKNDCRSFFICIGKIQPIHGKCPVNTVYSEINKQCTKNLSHCIRNNQFRCIQEGRFSDMFSNNIYYICVRNKNIFIRFKLKCQLGYRLNKKTVTCVNEAKSESLMISTSVDSDSKKSSDQSTSERKIKEKKKTKGTGDVCRIEGKFPDPNDCRRYYVCSKNSKSVFRQRTKKCDSDEVFHRDKKKCVDSESYECN